MNSIGDQITLKQLLERHREIEIPLIQRDFAQGRLGEEQIREEFLNALQDALERIPDDESLPLNLDFVYGSVEEDKDGRFFPLDGQQRLTTLFLLHWYLAWNDDRWDEFRALFSSGGNTSRFSYSVRPSSKEFFDELVAYSPDCIPAQAESLKGMIVDQPWYFRNWRLDPTIQSCLNMLGAIHDRFCDSEGLYFRLVDAKQPAITFQLLDLEDFGLSDDLYIKMNARGKPLTAFENFKARYESVLKKLFPDETRIIDGLELTLAEYFARQMDTNWADFFWAHRDEETNLYDKAVMNLFRTVALVTRDPESSSYLADAESLRYWLVKPTYSAFCEWKCLDRKFSEMLIILLDTWADEEKDFATQLPNSTYFDEVKIFEKAVTDPTGFSYVEIVQLAAYFVFLKEKLDWSNSDAFQEWMRVIFNLSVNTSYDRASDMQRSIAGINELVEHSEQILEYFATVEKPATGFSEQQIIEEKLKAQLIIENAKWRRQIDRAESHKYFRGQIEFLLEFCGALSKWRETGSVKWEITEHLSLQERFQFYLARAELMFNARGLVNLEMYRWERALLVLGDYLLPRGTQNHSFLVNPMTQPASWKRLLQGAGARVIEARKLLRDLWEDLDVDSDIGIQLDAMIEGAGNLDPWRKALVGTPKAIKYCENRCIRRVSDDHIYLLKRIQMNGTHAELFTFCLYHNEFVPLATSGDIEPLQLSSYVDVIGTVYEPGIQFTWSQKGRDVDFEFEWWPDHFLVFVNLDSLAELPDVKRLLLDAAKFEECKDRLERKISEADSVSVVCEIARVLAEYSGVHAPPA